MHFAESTSILETSFYVLFLPSKPQIEMKKSKPPSKQSSSSSSKLVQCRFHACVRQPHINKICSQGKNVMSRKLVSSTLMLMFRRLIVLLLFINIQMCDTILINVIGLREQCHGTTACISLRLDLQLK